METTYSKFEKLLRCDLELRLTKKHQGYKIQQQIMNGYRGHSRFFGNNLFICRINIKIQ